MGEKMKLTLQKFLILRPTLGSKRKIIILSRSSTIEFYMDKRHRLFHHFSQRLLSKLPAQQFALPAAVLSWLPFYTGYIPCKTATHTCAEGGLVPVLLGTFNFRALQFFNRITNQVGE
jgi:hypothetical protein